MTKAKHPAIALTPVKSAAVSAIGYDAAANTLAVKFKSGSTYHYYDVSSDLHKELTAEKSIGKALGKLKGRKFARVEP